MPKLVIALLTLTLAAALDRAPVGAAESTPVPAGSPNPTTTGTPTVMANGLEYIDDVVGTGAMPKDGQTVSIKYTIYVRDVKVEERTVTPMEFAIGKDQALKGLDEGVRTMKVGGKRRLLVPPSLGYGADGAGKIPPNTSMRIDVELVAIK